MYETELDKYFELMKAYPQEFENSGTLHIVTEKEVIENYIRQTGKKIGVLYESPYRVLVVDLVYNQPGEYYTYERMFRFPGNGGVVCVPVYKNRYLLLKQYRHAMRDYQYAFPRGCGEAGLSGIENAIKELQEEIGAQIRSKRILGSVIPDSGLSGKPVELYLFEIDSYEKKIGYEDIADVLEVSWEELTDMIAKHRITDGYTLSAYSYLVAENFEK